MIGSFQHFRFSFREVAPTMNEVLEYVQSSGLDKEHPAVVFTEHVLEKLDNLQGICGGYVIKKNEPELPTTGVVKIDDFTLHVGKQISRYLKDASYIALFLCTAGPDFSEITGKLNHEGDWMEAYLVDAIGSLTVENAMNTIWRNLAESMDKKGLKISNRYSPGYCNWDVSDQKILFQLIGDNPTGITLSETCLMSPVKSVSGIIGIGKNLKRYKYGCKICHNQTCIYRKLIHE